MKRVHCLYRNSTLGQADKETDEILIQKLECTKFAASQGWLITKELSGKSISELEVSPVDRDALHELKAATINGDFDILLVFTFDRLGRCVDETPFVAEWFINQGIEVWSAKEGKRHFDTYMDRMINYIRYWEPKSN